MKLRKFIYGLLLLIAVYSSLMYVDAFPTFLLNFLIFVVVICKLQTFISRRLISVQMKEEFALTKKGHIKHFFVQSEKKGILPVVPCEMTLQINDVSRQEKEITTVEFWVCKKESNEQDFIVQFSRCGYYEVSLKQVLVSDFLGLTQGKGKVNSSQRTSVLVMPEPLSLYLTLNRKIDTSVGERDEFSMTKSGNDPSQVHDIRSYMDGDKMQAIHWKLSQKMDTLLVKELSLSLGWPGKIFLDFERQQNLMNERVLQTLISLYFALQLLEIRFQIVWQQEDGLFVSCDSEATIEEIFYRLASSKLCLEQNTLEWYELQYPEKKCEHLFYLTDHWNENALYLEMSTIASHKTVFCLGAMNESVSYLSICLNEDDWKRQLESTPIVF